MVFFNEWRNLQSSEIVKLAKKYAKVMVDDAHAFGVIGKGGRGTASILD